jgi:hypothetical protein
MSSRRRLAQRPSNPSNTRVVRTEGYTYAAEVSSLCVFPGPLYVAPCAKPSPFDSHQNESLLLY